MSLRRAFLLGAAGVVSIAALVAIGAVVTGDFDQTDGKIFATLATTFVAGSAVVAGLALLARGESRRLAIAGIALATAGFALWSAEIWGSFDSDRFWKLLGVLTAWSIALLIITTTRLMLASPSLLRTLYPLTAGAAAGAALAVTVGVLRDSGDGWQLFAVLLILAILGEALAPVLERFRAAAEAPAERVLGVVAGVEVLAVRGRDARSVQIGGASKRLAAGEGIVVRERVTASADPRYMPARS